MQQSAEKALFYADINFYFNQLHLLEPIGFDGNPSQERFSLLLFFVRRYKGKLGQLFAHRPKNYR